MALTGITLINCVGTIDSDYRLEIQVPLVNLSGESFTLMPSERIAQMVIAPVTQAELLEVAVVNTNTERSGGCGSTGRH